MKNLLCCFLGLNFLLLTACAGFGTKRVNYPDSNLGVVNPAPKNLAPPLGDDALLNSKADFHFTMGETLSYEGQSPRAIEEFKSTLIYDPKSVHVRLRLAAEYARIGMVTEAAEQGEAAVKMDPTNIDAHMLLGGLYSGLKMFTPAKSEFEAVLNREPGHTEAAIYLGALKAEEKNYDEAIGYFAGLTKNPKFKETEKAYYYMGRIRGEQGGVHLKEAEKFYAQALSQRPEYPEAALALAGLMKASGREAEMARLLTGYQSKFGPQPEMARQLAHHYLSTEKFDKALEQLEIVDSYERDNLNIKIQIALILIEGKKYEDAAVRLEDVLQQAPESDKVRYYLGAVYEEMGRQDLAIFHYQKVAVSSTYFADAAIHAAHLVKSSGGLEKAITYTEEVLKKTDELPQIYAYYATLLEEAKNYKKAAAMLVGAVEKFPGNTQLRFFFATMHDRLGNVEDTIAQLSKVIEQDRNHVQALNYLAFTYAELGRNLEEAMGLAQRAIELQPGDGYIMDTLGWIFFKKGDNESAIKYLEAAYSAKNDEAIIAEHLGDAYLRHQMWQKAQKMYQRAAAMDVDSNQLKKIEKKIANIQSQIQRTPAAIQKSSDRAPASSR